MNSPLLLYIGVWHANLLPPTLTVGEARDFGPRIARVESLIPVRDASTDIVSKSCAVHKLIEEPQVQVQLVEQVATESIHSSEAGVNQGEDEMAVRTRGEAWLDRA